MLYSIARHRIIMYKLYIYRYYHICPYLSKYLSDLYVLMSKRRPYCSEVA